MISYPLQIPKPHFIQSFEMRVRNAVAVSRSPYTFASQAHAYPGQMWELDITLAPMRRDIAEQWLAFLISLRGQYGTFMMGDPLNVKPRGNLTSLVVSGQAGANAVTAKMPFGQSIKAGDYIQLGEASDATLHKVLTDYTGTGQAQTDVLDIWPAIRRDRDNVTAILNNTQGIWRLASNETMWSVNNIAVYGMSFGCVEAL